MRVLVSDTSVLIDLERAGLLDRVFSLDAEFVVPDLLFERELRDYGGDRLVRFGLRVESLEPEGVEQAQAFRKDEARLTVPDSFALALALRRSWILLTGDGPLRALAGVKSVECHGVLWVLDLMEAQDIVTHANLRDGLGLLARHPRCRLPKGEIEVRLARYAKCVRKD